MANNVRNLLIVLALAALVVLVPGGGPAANVAIQAVSIAFLGSIAWVASLMYREHRVALHSLADARRATLYAAVAVATLALTASSQLLGSGGGTIVLLALLGAAAYAAFAVVWSARRY